MFRQEVAQQPPDGRQSRAACRAGSRIAAPSTAQQVPLCTSASDEKAGQAPLYTSASDEKAGQAPHFVIGHVPELRGNMFIPARNMRGQASFAAARPGSRFVIAQVPITFWNLCPPPQKVRGRREGQVGSGRGLRGIHHPALALPVKDRRKLEKRLTP